MDIVVTVLALLVTDLPAAATVVPLSAASQYVGFFATVSQLGSMLISFTYYILFQHNVSGGYTRVINKVFDRVPV